MPSIVFFSSRTFPGHAYSFNASIAAGVIFFNNVGFLGMCGHGTIGLMTTLAFLGRIAPGEHRIETPVLGKSTPEGARDYLVPSRVHPGEFYALPQSPQLFKQMLMMAGFDRYYQIVKCFRDEDLRADRQPEFTQIDIETSFLDELEIRGIMEELVRTMFRETIDVALADPFPIMTYADAMRDYGSDKPDLRVPLKLTELTDLMRTVDFKVFRAAIDGEWW